jgi:hypothetical protein
MLHRWLVGGDTMRLPISLTEQGQPEFHPFRCAQTPRLFGGLSGSTREHGRPYDECTMVPMLAGHDRQVIGAGFVAELPGVQVTGPIGG